MLKRPEVGENFKACVQTKTGIIVTPLKTEDSFIYSVIKIIKTFILICYFVSRQMYFFPFIHLRKK